ncbi:MAG TPA: LysM domain-containing protein [Allosphingosinicella sp.]
MRPKLIALVPLALVGAAAGPGTDTSTRSACGANYVVVRHDTLYSIARRCHDSVARIAAANRIANPARIRVGQVLMLERASARAGKPDDGPALARDAGFAYAMARQDTLFSLARWARVGVHALLAANPGVDPHKIEIGDLIRLPRGAVDPQPMRIRERGPATATVAAPLPSPAAAPLPRAAPDRPAPRRHAAPSRPTPPPHDDRGDDDGKPDDGNLHGRNQPAGM